MKKWEIQNNFKFQPAGRQGQISNFKLEKLVDILLKNRGVVTKKEKEGFLNPQLESVTVESVGIKRDQLKKALERIKLAIEKKEQIVVFGDYDVDGICGTAILWETLHSLGAKVLPYIPHRIDEGYGLSIKGIESIINVIPNSFQNLKKADEILNRVQDDKVKLIITVDNGIVAHEAVKFANDQGIDIIITDHHVPSKTPPKAYAIVHTTQLCGTGVAYLLSKEIREKCHSEAKPKNLVRSFAKAQDDNRINDHLALVALATVADLVPLKNGNRTLLYFGLKELRNTKRIGIVELCQEAGISQQEISTYDIGHIIAPRLNAMGRMEYAMDSLRLLCTRDHAKAKILAQKLGLTNKERQLLTQETVTHARSLIVDEKKTLNKLLFISHESYQQGVIGLVAGRLVEEYYRPTIVVAKGEKYSKASARSIAGFNIIEFIRSASELLVDAGGHPMAAGFTVETEKLVILQKKLEESVAEMLNNNSMLRILRIDCELPLTYVTKQLYSQLQKLAPFGMANAEPTFVSRNVEIENMRFVGRENKHLKLNIKYHPFDKLRTRIANSKYQIEAIAFGMGERAKEFHVKDLVDIAYTIDLNKWNGNSLLQLKIKDIMLKRP